MRAISGKLAPITPLLFGAGAMLQESDPPIATPGISRSGILIPMPRSRTRSLLRPIPRRAFRVSLLAYLLVRGLLAFHPGYEGDIRQYKEWAVGSAAVGFPAVYERTEANYPPLSLYVFHALGRLYLASRPAGAAISPESLPTALVKLPHAIFDLLLGALLYRLVASVGLWGGARTGPGWGRLAASLYWWNPAVLFGTAYWGLLDPIHSLLALAALAALGRCRSAAAGAALAAAGLTKPLAAPLVPLVVLAAAARRGWRGVLAAGAAGIAVALVLFAPFIATGRGAAALRRVLLDAEAMPFTSVNAHNLWWLIGAWSDANRQLLGPLTPKQLGLALFAGATALLLLRSVGWLRRSDDEAYRAGLFVLGAAVVSAFFFFATYMHENHLFLALPFLLAVAGRGRGLAWLAAGCSLAIFLNEALHDAEIPYRPPLSLAGESSVLDPYRRRPYGRLQLLGTYLDSLLVAGVAAGTFAAAWRLDGAGARAPARHVADRV